MLKINIGHIQLNRKIIYCQLHIFVSVLNKILGTGLFNICMFIPEDVGASYYQQTSCPSDLPGRNAEEGQQWW